MLKRVLFHRAINPLYYKHPGNTVPAAGNWIAYQQLPNVIYVASIGMHSLYRIPLEENMP